MDRKSTEQTRQRCAKALRRAWPGRCLTTLIALEGKDPEVTTVRSLHCCLVRLVGGRPLSTHNRVKRARDIAKENLAKHDKRKRWLMKRGGIMGSPTLLLWELDWAPRKADSWFDPASDEWHLRPEDADGDPTDVIDMIASQVELTQWPKGKSTPHWHWAGTWSGRGRPCSTSLDDWKRRANIKGMEHYSRLHVLALRHSTGKRTLRQLKNCASVEPWKITTTAFGVIAHAERSNITHQRTDHLRDRAKEGLESNAAFWLRGITPRPKSCPPPCATEPAEIKEGQVINATLRREIGAARSSLYTSVATAAAEPCQATGDRGDVVGVDFSSTANK